MMGSSLVVRPLRGDDEYALQFQLGDQAFGQQPSVENARRWMRYVTSMPEFRPEQARGAFLDGRQVGGYLLYERKMRVGAASISTGCIGAVVTHPDYRNRGVATALMQDAISFAHANGHALLLLDGIDKFYHRFGYVDVIDLSVIDIDRAAILAQPPCAYTTRTARPTDAADMLALYRRHYYPYTGSFTRTLEQQAHPLLALETRAELSASLRPLLAIAPSGDIQGYITTDEGNMGHEMAADNWEAMLALLQQHAHRLERADAPASLRYRVPLNSSMAQTLIEQLEVPDTSHWQNPAEGWAVKHESYHHRDAGWMARFVHLPTLLAALLPELQARWRQALARWTGDLQLVVGDEACVLHIAGSDLSLDDSHSGVGETLTFTAQAFTQLIFGYRPAAWAVRASPNSASDDALAALEVLFPPGHAWIARSDWF